MMSWWIIYTAMPPNVGPKPTWTLLILKDQLEIWKICSHMSILLSQGISMKKNCLCLQGIESKKENSFASHTKPFSLFYGFDFYGLFFSFNVFIIYQLTFCVCCGHMYQFSNVHGNLACGEPCWLAVNFVREYAQIMFDTGSSVNLYENYARHKLETELILHLWLT